MTRTRPLRDECFSVVQDKVVCRLYPAIYKSITPRSFSVKISQSPPPSRFARRCTHHSATVSGSGSCAPLLLKMRGYTRPFSKIPSQLRSDCLISYMDNTTSRARSCRRGQISLNFIMSLHQASLTILTMSFPLCNLEYTDTLLLQMPNKSGTLVKNAYQL